MTCNNWTLYNMQTFYWSQRRWLLKTLWAKVKYEQIYLLTEYFLLCINILIEIVQLSDVIEADDFSNCQSGKGLTHYCLFGPFFPMQITFGPSFSRHHFETAWEKFKLFIKAILSCITMLSIPSKSNRFLQTTFPH